MANRVISKIHSDSSDLASVLASLSLDPRARLLEVSPTLPKTKIYMTGEGLSVKLNDKWWVLDTPQDLFIVSILDTGSITPGEDYYFYICDNNGSVDFKVSTSSTYPSGYTADTSYKLGGFHTLCANVGTISGHSYSGFVAGDILKDSVWDLRHRPKCEPAGMTFVEDVHLWCDIYLNLNGISVFGALYSKWNWVDADGDVHSYKKRLMTHFEGVHISKDSSFGTACFTIPPTNTGGNIDSASRRVISGSGVEDITTTASQWLSTFTTAATGSFADSRHLNVDPIFGHGTIVSWSNQDHQFTDINNYQVMWAFDCAQIGLGRRNGRFARQDHIAQDVYMAYRGVCEAIL